MGDSYRPGGGGSDNRRSQNDRMMTFTSGGGNNYRPGGARQGHGENHHEFTFSSNHDGPRFPPSGPANDPASRRRPRRGGSSYYPPRESGRTNSGAPRGRGGQRGGFRSKAAHDRALLRVQDGGSPERSFGIAEGSNRFLNVDDLSDDEEADMETDSDRSDTDDNPNRKTARTESNGRADGDSTPKWCNPDPYTSLPPPEERTGKKLDFVKLIRKAKNEAATKAEDANNAVAANDDFISFGDEDKSPEPEEEPRPAHHRQDPVEGSLNDLNYNEPATDNSLAGRPAHASFVLEPPLNGPASKRKRMEMERSIITDWTPYPGMDTAPWVNKHQSYQHLANDPLKWLHNEILDFYDYVAPTKREHEIRNQLVQRIQSALGRNRFPYDDGRILCFGSFPAGLYLPTADMDLVYTSDRHYGGGEKVIDLSNKGTVNSVIRKAARRLETVHIATNVVCITKARVPILKFTDRMTGLQVDISFENLSGVQAQATFMEWKREYPDMIYMVALLKQFLIMRGLNEVHTGGLGGFSIICLIVSYIQHAGKPENLGACFLGFLKYYGVDFDLSRYRIQMHPPDIVPKTDVGIDGRPEKPTGLSIQDPNSPENNISGGSHKAHEVFKAFGNAYRVLTDRIADRTPGRSLLECLLGGNYTSYIMHRRHMDKLRADY